MPEPEPLRNYLNDILFVPLALGIAVWLQRNIVLRQKDYALSKMQIILVVAYISLMFEGVIPFFKARYTADFLDVLCYSLGGLLFYRFGNAGGSNMVQKGINKQLPINSYQ